MQPIGVLVAMDLELRHLLDLVEVTREERDGIWLDRYARLGTAELVIVNSGMGMVSAAAATERLIDAHRPRAVLNIGCAGAHRRDILPGDVVIGDRVINHAATHILANGEELFMGVPYDVGGETIAGAELPIDPDLLARAREAAEGYTPAPWPSDAAEAPTGPRRDPVIHVGTVVSSDIWTQLPARLDVLHLRHNSLCEDMETAAIAQVCAMHGVPFLTIKDISNNEYLATTDIAGGFVGFPEAEVGRRAAALLARVVERGI